MSDPAPDLCRGCAAPISQEWATGRRRRFCTRACYLKFLSETKHQKKKRREHIAAKRCVDCTLPAVPGKQLCERHSAIHTDACRLLRSRRRAAGACTACGLPAGVYLCASCLQKKVSRQRIDARRLRRERLGKHLCCSCGEPSGAFATCVRCRAKRRYDHWKRRFIEARKTDALWQRLQSVGLKIEPSDLIIETLESGRGDFTFPE